MLRSSFEAVVRRFLRDDHVVNVALTYARGGDAYELDIPLQVGDRRRAAVPHAHPQATNQLVDHGRNSALVGHATFDTLRDELVGGIGLRGKLEFFLEVPIAAAAAHRAD